VDAKSVYNVDGTLPPLPTDDPIPAGVTEGEITRVFGPSGTVPYLRPVFESYIDGSANEDSVETFARKIAAGHPLAVPDPVVIGAGRLYSATPVGERITEAGRK